MHVRSSELLLAYAFSNRRLHDRRTRCKERCDRGHDREMGQWRRQRAMPRRCPNMRVTMGTLSPRSANPCRLLGDGVACV